MCGCISPTSRPTDAREREGLRVVSIARTLVDISAFWSVGQLARALDEALRNHRTTLWAVEQCVRRLESGPNRRCSVIEMLVDERRQSIVVGDSRLEQLVYLPLVDAGVELPVPQFPVAVGGRRFRLDFAWPDAKLYVEVDGWDTHRTFTDFHGDRRRDALLVAAGWTPLHFTEASTSCDIVTMVTTTLARLRGIASALAPPRSPGSDANPPVAVEKRQNLGGPGGSRGCARGYGVKRSSRLSRMMRRTSGGSERLERVGEVDGFGQALGVRVVRAEQHLPDTDRLR